MIKIAHRINSIEELCKTPQTLGVELDLRENSDTIIVTHDPFTRGESFDEYLKFYKHNLLIVNIKCEGIASNVISILEQFKIKKFFLLGLGLPETISLVNSGEKRIALRYSEFEKIDSLLTLKAKVEWVWVDCYHGFPLDQLSFSTLKKYFKICLASPELHGHPISWIEEFKEKLKSMPVEAVCTKKIDSWDY